MSLLDLWSVQRFHPGNGPESGGLGLIAAANNVVSLQCPNGGWGWPYGGCGTTYSNITGSIAMGLLQAQAATGMASYSTAAVAGANHDQTFQFSYGGTRFGSFGPAFFVRLSASTGNSAWHNDAEASFFDRLAAGTYGDASGSTCGATTWFPGNTYAYIARHKCMRSGGLINLRPWDMQFMPWVAGIIGNPDSAPGDGVPQQQTFLNNSVLDGLNTLDAVNPGVNPAYFGEIIGLAGAVHGLALNGTTSFPAVNAPLYTAIDGMTSLCALADHLASLQHVSGGWYWTSNVSDPTDLDSQTTAYALMALIAAQNAGCGPYTSQINLGRAWLWGMQDVLDGGFFSYIGGTKNIATNSEVINALGIPAGLSLTTATCATSGTVTVTLGMSDMSQEIVGGQFFLEYDNAVLSFVSAVPGGSPFTNEVFESVNTGAGTIDYAVGVAGGGPGTTTGGSMVILTFAALQQVCNTADLVTFRPHAPPTQLTDDQGNAILPALEDLNAVSIDSTPPVALGPPIYANGFEVGTNGWGTFANPSFAVTRVPSGTNGITSASGAFHAQSSASGSAGNWGGYDFTPGQSSSGPGVAFQEYITSVGIYLDVNGGWANNTRFDFSSAINGTNGLHRRDFIFNAGFYNDTDGSPGSGTNRFVISASFNSQPGSAFAKNPAFGPIAIATTGWYTFKHRFYNNAGVLAVDMTIHDSLGNLVNSWTRSNATDLIGLIGGNRYAWFDYNQFSVLAFDNSSLSRVGGPDITVNADAGSCTAVVTWTPPTATDNCTPAGSILVGSTHDPGDEFPAGTSTVTYTFTDLCGNQTQTSFDVTVNSLNTMLVDVDLGGSFSGTFTRCIRFELSGVDSAVVDQNVTFVNGVASAVSVDVPCGNYACVTARDRKHTLRRTDSALGIAGVNYVADFTGSGALVGGNLNDDPWIDILDFGIFVGQFATSPGADTPCGYTGNHADISGDGLVHLADFTFISINFLNGHDPNCGSSFRDAGVDGPFAHRPGPITRISVKELIRRGMPDLVVADLNRDGWLDELDIAEFLNH